MEAHTVWEWLEQLLGLVILVLTLVDVFLTILYARAGSSIYSYWLARLIWRFFIWIARPFERKRGIILSYCGPIILVAIVALWACALTLGSALIIHPNLGTSITSSDGNTPTDFITALYVGGSSISLVGSSAFTPQTSAFRLLYLFNSLVGVSIISVTLTYLMQIYTALQRRNTLGLHLHLLAGETGDAAELVAGLGPEGEFTGGYTNLASLAQELTVVKESHHFYPVIFYFRFYDTHYSMSWSLLLSLDTVTLIKSALDDSQYGWLKESASVEQLWRGGLLLAKTLEETFLPDGALDSHAIPDEATRERWRRRYFVAQTASAGRHPDYVR